MDDLALAPDPDLALATLSRVAETRAHGAADLVAAVDSDAAFRSRAYAVLGTSAALGDHLVRHPEDWVVLAAPAPSGDEPPAPHPGLATGDAVRADLLRAVGADPSSARPRAGDAEDATYAALRSAYRRRLLAIAAADIADGAVVRRRRRPPSPTSPTPRSRRLWRSPAPSTRPTPTAAGSPSSPSASAAGASSTTSPTSTSCSSPSPSRARTRPRRCWRRPGSRRRSCGSASRPPARARSGRSTPTCGPRGRTARWCARWRPTRATTGAGRRRGSSRRCSRRVRSRATSPSARRSSTSSRRSSGPRRTGRTSSRTCRRCAAGSRRTSRRRTPSASSSSAWAGCATSSSRSSCSSSCTGAAT